MKTTRNTLSAAQRNMLANLARIGIARTIMQLVRMEHAGRGHFASYARFHRLRKRGFIAVIDGGYAVTAKGAAAL